MSLWLLLDNCLCFLLKCTKSKEFVMLKNIILVVFLLSVQLLAEDLNIINKEKNAEIFLNNQSIGVESITKNLKPGNYLIEAKKYDKIFFSKMVELKPNKVTTILIDGSSDITMPINTSFDMKKVLSTNNWGFGGIIGPISGFMFSKKFKNQFVLQPTFVLGEDLSTYGLRVLYRFNAREFGVFGGKNDGVATFYTGLGYATVSVDDRSISSYIDSIFTPLIGVEYGPKNGLFKTYLEVQYYSYEDLTKTSYWTWSSGYNEKYSSKTRSGISLSLGLTVDF